MTNAKRLLNREEDQRVVEAIRQAERNTSGETKQRNGVLIYLAVKDHKFAILGDEGINKVVGNDFWNDVKDLMQRCFKEGQFVEGLEQGIQRCGEKLKTYFPYQTDDTNEIPDDISYGNQ